MDLFIEICTRAPTVVFSVLLLAAIGYWLIVLLGLAEIDVFSGLGEGGDAGDIGGMTGLLTKLHLDGLPITLILSSVALIGWIVCYFADLLLLRFLPFDGVRTLIGVGVAFGAFLLALPVTGLVLYPVRKLFRSLKPTDSVSLLGRSAVVRSPVVSESQGQAHVDDGGAGLILQVRAEAGLFKRGDRVVLIEYLDAANAYRVIPDGATADSAIAGQPPPP